MATIVLGAVGTAIGGGFGGAVLGLSGAAIGGMIGSGIGSMVDSWIVSSLMPGQRIEGQRMDSLRMVSATEGVVIPRLYGRMRIGGNIIWATDFREEVNTHRQGGGKGGGPKVTTTEYLYYASFAVALCEGSEAGPAGTILSSGENGGGGGPAGRGISGIGRVWADGEVVDLSEVTWRWYPGSETQPPDPFISAKMGAANTPAYRGTAYVVFEELPLSRFGNRLPQLSFEVFRPLDDDDTAEGLARAVTIIPASGEFSYATQIVRKNEGGDSSAENVNAMAETADMVVSLDRLEAMVPSVESASLVVSWFGDDLRAGQCSIRPKVEMPQKNTTPAWIVNGVNRANALVVSEDDQGRPVYGGTPADFSVVQAIREMKARGLRVTFYPFVMMDVPAGNTLPDPYSDNAATIGQPVLPWRGRITCSPAAGFAGTVDKTATAAAQVNAFFGNAQPSDFSVSDGVVTWTGPAGDWGLRRMILHYAHLCTAAGGVDAFLIGSEMRGLTQIRSGASTYPAVQQFRDLAGAVRAILGPDTKISYAADWSEYFGHHPSDGSGDVFFHLDPLWADANVDFIGIDNYMPLSDWRVGWDHADAQAWPSIHDRAYLQSNIAGGEGFDWFYASEADRISQTRTPILDTITPQPSHEAISAMPGGSPTLTRNPGATSPAIPVGARRDSMTLACTVRFPATITDGLIFEVGFAQGIWIGVFGGTLRFLVDRNPDREVQYVDYPAAGLAGQAVEIVAVLDYPAAEIWLAINGAVVGRSSFSSPFIDLWAANGGMGYGVVNGVNFGTGLVSLLPWPGVLLSNAQWWQGSIPTTAIAPPVVAEPWIWRYKDIHGWWSNPHRNRPGGVPASGPTAWVPQSKPIWFTELGCPAVDRGTNQPNVFFDPKSSESFVPYFSRGWRDDAIQRAYLEATWLFWRDLANNPASTGYAGRMVNVSECAAWTWDARPYPFFPELSDLWADGENWRLGHWLTGRLGAVSLAALVRHLCLRAGLPEAWIDVSNLTDAVDGYVITALESPRTSITMLARHFGFDAVESEGRIRFVMRGRAPVAAIAPDDMVAAAQGDVMDLTRGQETELPQALKWQMARADEAYDTITVESRRITVEASRVSSDSFPMAVPPEEADRRCRRALMEAWVGRETGSFRLPPSMLALDPADVILLDHDGRLVEMRILTASDAEARAIETIRQDRAAYDLPPGSPRAAHLARPVVFGAPLALIMDLPQLREDHVPHHPLIAAHARPWPGQMAVFRSPDQDGFDLVTVFSGRARMGVLTSDLYSGPLARFDLGNSVYVDLLTGTLKSVTDLRLFGGENSLAVEQPTGGWEILQAGEAELIAPGRYRLSRLLRGQRGTDADMAPMVPEGARVVVLDDMLADLPVAEADLGLPWNWRIGPSSRPVSDDSYVAQTFTPTAMGLRPFSPVHVEQPWRWARVPGDLTIRWIRRDRSLAADNWNAVEIPMTETGEAWQVQILDGASVTRTLTASTTSAVYTGAQQVADWGAPLGPGASLDIRIAQIGQAFGAGAAPVTTLWF